jgi:hypothetical protein
MSQTAIAGACREAPRQGGGTFQVSEQDRRRTPGGSGDALHALDVVLVHGGQGGDRSHAQRRLQDHCSPDEPPRGVADADRDDGDADCRVQTHAAPGERHRAGLDKSQLIDEIPQRRIHDLAERFPASGRVGEGVATEAGEQVSEQCRCGRPESPLLVAARGLGSEEVLTDREVGKALVPAEREADLIRREQNPPLIVDDATPVAGVL